MRTAIDLAESPSLMYFSLRKPSFLNKGVVEIVDSKRNSTEDRSVVQNIGTTTICLSLKIDLSKRPQVQGLGVSF
jgi:hypothetical protein